MDKFFILFCFSLLTTTTLYGQAQPVQEKLSLAIDSKTYVFEANQASGLRGRMIQLDPGYILDVSPEKVKGDLPFFGRSYQGTLGGTAGGLQFEIVDFDYSVKPRKKGGWEVVIKSKEPSEVRSLYLTIQKTGNASLRILSNSRQGMSFNGIIKN